MTIVYYRDSDGKVIGHHTSSGQINIKKELDSWGAGVSALEVSSFPSSSGKIKRVVNGQIILEPDPVEEDKKIAKSNAIEKLKKATGLTDAELKAILGG